MFCLLLQVKSGLVPRIQCPILIAHDNPIVQHQLLLGAPRHEMVPELKWIPC